MNVILIISGATSRFWMQHNHPIELSSREMMLQRLNYIHQNPVEIGFVEKEEEWLHSSCGDYYGNRKGRIDLVFMGLVVGLAKRSYDL